MRDRFAGDQNVAGFFSKASTGTFRASADRELIDLAVIFFFALVREFFRNGILDVVNGSRIVSALPLIFFGLDDINRSESVTSGASAARIVE